MGFFEQHNIITHVASEFLRAPPIIHYVTVQSAVSGPLFYKIVGQSFYFGFPSVAILP